MTGSSSPCGACKFLRRKCVNGCVFSPYFCHEQGATHFAAIHKVFGASNVSKLLAHLPDSHRSEAAVTISYEAQARLQDPIYGCVSHIFALQQQVVNLQAQLASLKQQAAQCIINNSSTSANPNPNDHKFYGESHSSPHDLHGWWQSLQNQMAISQFDADNSYYSSGSMDLSPSVKHENPIFAEQNPSYGSMDSFEDQQWPLQDVGDELQSVAFGHLHLSC
ncbi:LOB domain-containing protein 29-like [Salvia miltiorrhiza]|uniref:LOB domain-containing protein 29-like n=1 Tax=Salvia miltiorrhiza TaxID=226208 RepID=UPI0025AB9EEB|nr:LOB domain-containing protein 29-like [Salvia miltiorrhiza]